MSEPQPWDPTGDVLVVAHDLDPEVEADLLARLSPEVVTVLDRGPREGAADSAGSGETEPGRPPVADQDFPPESDATVAAITAALAANPRISMLLAQGRWAARDVWRVVRPRPDLLGFTHVDNLERARNGALPIDVTPLGRRRASHRFSVEFAGSDFPSWPSGARHRILIGPGNDFGQALGWAQAGRLLRGSAALSLTVGDDGFPADLIATTADWSALSVRNRVLRIAAAATHVVIDADSAAAHDIAGAIDTGVHSAEGLSPCVPPRSGLGRPADRHVVVIGDGPDPQTDWRITRLSDLPVGVWATAVLSATVIVDHRARFDTLVARAMAQGSVLVANLTTNVPCAPVGTDVFGTAEGRRLSQDGMAYVRDHCDPDRVATQLRKALGIRWWR